MSIKTGGPAFPEIFTDVKQINDLDGTKISNVYSVGGMTLRDYFAAKSAPIFFNGNFLEAAKTAYKLADAMLIVRELSK